MLKVVQVKQESQSAASVPSLSLLDEITGEGARRMLAAALRAEADSYIDQFAVELDEDGHRLVVRNGHAEPRTVVCSAGAWYPGTGEPKSGP